MSCAPAAPPGISPHGVQLPLRVFRSRPKTLPPLMARTRTVVPAAVLVTRVRPEELTAVHLSFQRPAL